MCYAKPGPRCYGHAKKTFDTKKEALVKAQQKLAQDPNNPNKRAYKAAKGALIDAQKDMYESVSGLEVLREELYPQYRDGVITHEKFISQYTDALNGYEARMHAYDSKFKTVNGRIPSPMYLSSDPEFIKLKKELEESSNNLHETQNDTSLDIDKKNRKIARESAKVETLRNKIKHAEATQKHIYDRVISGEDVRNALAEKQMIAIKKATAMKPARKATHSSKAGQKPTPHLPLDPIRDANGRHWKGAKYDHNMTNQQVASESRKDLKRAKETGALPADYDYKVSNSGKTITVKVIGDHSKNVENLTSSYRGLKRKSTDGLNLSRKVSSYPEQYAYNYSDAQFDNYNQSHYIRVEFIDEKTGRSVLHS